MDIENISLIGQIISCLLQRDFKADPNKTHKQQRAERVKMGLIITHTGFILDYVTEDKEQVLYEDVLSCRSNPEEIFHCIKEEGYKECVKCAN